LFLTEKPNVFDIKGGHKVRVDIFKGFTPEQNQEIKTIQQKQIQEHSVRL
jgi:RIB43A